MSYQKHMESGKFWIWDLLHHCFSGAYIIPRVLKKSSSLSKESCLWDFELESFFRPLFENTTFYIVRLPKYVPGPHLVQKCPTVSYRCRTASRLKTALGPGIPGHFRCIQATDENFFTICFLDNVRFLFRCSSRPSPSTVVSDSCTTHDRARRRMTASIKNRRKSRRSFAPLHDINVIRRHICQ